MLQGLSLGISVGIEEQRGVLVHQRMLLTIFPLGAQAQRYVIIAIEESRMGTAHQHGWFVTCVGVRQAACGQIEHAHKQGYEHERVVALTHRAIDGLNDELGRRMGHRRTAEHTSGHSHNQRRGHSLACHITYTEV